MFPFLRFLHLAGVAILTEALTPHQAAAIFKLHGAVDADFATPHSLKLARNKLVKLKHSDKRGGVTTDDEDTKHLNAAYDVLKALPGGYHAGSAAGRGDDDDRPQRRPGPAYERPTYEPTPAWQTDPRSQFHSINRQDYHDVNFFKMRMWELSGHSRQQYTVQSFDGAFFRLSLTVFGSPDIFPDMAEAMVTWNGKRTRAVFVQQGGDPDLLLIYLDGHDIVPPVPMEHDSFNLNPGNDQQFLRRLPGLLDAISARQRG